MPVQTSVITGTVAHKHSATGGSSDGGKLAVGGLGGDTSFDLANGSIMYSNGTSLEELTIGGAGDSLTVSGGLPAWGGGGGVSELVGHTTTITGGTTLDLSFSAITITDVSRLVIVANIGAQGANPSTWLRVNNISTTTYETEGEYIVSGTSNNMSDSGKAQWDVGKWQCGGKQFHNHSLTSNRANDRLQLDYNMVAENGINFGSGYNTTSGQTTIDQITLTASVGLDSGSSLTVYRQNVS